MNKLDIDFVRKQFPVFKTDLGRQVGFMDNAGGSYVAGAVINRLHEFYTNYKVQPYGANPISNRAGVAMDEGRQTMAALLNAPIELVTLGASSTQCFNTLAIACAPLVQAGNEVIVTEQDHESNIGSWERLCKQQNATLVVWKVDPLTGELNLDELKSLLTTKTALVAVTHSSNIIGTINPIRKIADLVHAKGARLVVDGVSYAPHSWPNLDELGADAYVFSTYKTYGTHQGVMVIKEDFLMELAPQCHFFNVPYLNKRLDSAGPDHAAIGALAGIGDYFSAFYTHHFGADNTPLYHKAREASVLMNQHENELCEYLLENLRKLPLRIYGRPTMNGREANVAFSSDAKSSKEIADGLANFNIAAKNGHFYAYRLLEAMGVKDMNDGVVRISLSHYNTMEEMERCVAALHSLLAEK